MRLLKKLFEYIKLPKPYALPMKTNPFIDEYTWSDWHEEMKEKHPFRYFITETIPHYFAVKITLPLRDLKWNIIDLFRKPHILDLRCEEYKGGYIDPCSAILFANFNILKRYVEKCNPYNLRRDYTEEEIDRQGLREQQNHYDEAHRIYHYWVVERPEMSHRNHAIYVAMKNAGEAYDKREYTILRAQWLRYNDEYNKLEQEMLERLIKIRQGLWT